MKIDAGMIKIIVVVAILLIVVVTIATIVANIRRKLRQVSQTFFGTDSLIDGWNKQDQRLARTPKSVSSMTRLMLPQIQSDFKDFSWPQFRQRAENTLKSALLAITTGVMDALSDESEELKNQVRYRIEDNIASNAMESYTNIHIHQTEIADYRKKDGKCIIKIQSAVEYVYYKEMNGKLVAGRKDRKTQTKYNMELVYIQDIEEIESKGLHTAFGINCPNCGAPVKNLGELVCEYCGSMVTPINIKVWSLHKFAEVNYNNS